MNQQNSAANEFRKKLLNYAGEKPFLTIWNLILFLGGLFLLAFFWRINYLPQVNLPSLTGVLASVALIGLLLVLILVVSPILPGLYFRFAVNPDPDKTRLREWRNFLWSYFAAALFFVGLLLLSGGWSTESRYFTCGVAVCLFVGGIIGAWLGRVKNVEKEVIENQKESSLEKKGGSAAEKADWLGELLSILLNSLIWLLSLFFAIYLFIMPMSPHAQTTEWILGVVWVLYVIVVNFIISSLRPDKAPVMALVLAVTTMFFLIFTVWSPALISGGIVRVLGLGNINNASLLVSANVCQAIDQLDGALCKINESNSSGLIPDTEIVSRIGSEYLLEFRFPLSSPTDCKDDQIQTARVWRVTVNSKDVISGVLDRPANIFVSDKNKRDCGLKEQEVKPLDPHPQTYLPVKGQEESLRCKYENAVCNSAKLSKDRGASAPKALVLPK